MDIRKTDAAFMKIFDNFLQNDVKNEEHAMLDDKTRMIAVLAVLIDCQGREAFGEEVRNALKAGVTPVEIKEIVYQSAAYMGYGRMIPFLYKTNEIFEEEGIKLPIKDQATVTDDTRLEAGNQKQVDIFGEGMKDFYKKGNEKTRHINKWLAANCFGDYYTRDGLDDKTREMITFCFLAGQGGCEPQLTSHAAGNMGIGNDRGFLIRMVSQCLPYIGYPRSLNALECIKKAAEK